MNTPESPAYMSGKMEPPPPLPGPGGRDAYQPGLSGTRREMTNSEVADYLQSRNGERDVYYLYKGRPPSLRQWAVFLLRYPLLCCRVQVRGEVVSFVHLPSLDVEQALDFARARSHYTTGDLVLSIHKRRCLANDKLAYLITGDEAYLLVVAACVDWGWGDKLRRVMEDESCLEKQLRELTMRSVEEADIAAERPRLFDAAAAVLRWGAGGQVMPEAKGAKRNIYLRREEYSALKKRCKYHEVEISHLLVAACAVAHAQRTLDRREPVLIHLSSKCHGARRQSAISLPSLLPEPPDTLLWRRAKQAASLRRFHPHHEAQRAKIAAAAEMKAAMDNPGLGLGTVMPRRESPQPPDGPPPPPDEKILMHVSVELDGMCVESGRSTGPALDVVARETMTLVFTDTPDVFVDDVIALIEQ